MAEQRHDLAAMFVRLAKVLVDAERPVLDGHGVEMWEYVVLLALRERPVGSQARLAELTGRDKTRLIPILDRLASAGLVSREPDPGDRRNRVVRLTDAGRALVDNCQAGIRRMERERLDGLPEADRATFIELLERVVDLLAPWL